jgi:hypothetical protein
MAWSDAARAAALEARRRKAREWATPMDARTGRDDLMKRHELAAKMKELRARIRRGEFKTKGKKEWAKAQLSNYRYAGKRTSLNPNTSAVQGQPAWRYGARSDLFK